MVAHIISNEQLQISADNVWKHINIYKIYKMVIRKVYITYSRQKVESGNNYQQMHVIQTSNIINMQACTTACFLAKIATNN